MTGYLNARQLKNFEAKINYNGRQTPYVDTPCHEWTAYLHSVTGYGIVNINKKPKGAHIVAMMHYTGWRPDPNIPWHKQECRHLCGNRKCVNVNHLKIGARSENFADKLIHGTDNRGIKHPMQKIPPEVAQQIKYELFEKPLKYGDMTNIAKRYGVTRTNVKSIYRGVAWNYLPKYKE